MMTAGRLLAVKYALEQHQFGRFRNRDGLDMIAIFLAKAGLWLFLVGLVLGAAIPKFTSPRLALSAHLTAVQSGTALLAIAWFWPQLVLGNAYADFLGHALWISFWMLSAGLTLAAAWGASRVLPIAGAGYAATALKEWVAAAVIMVACVALILVVGALLVMSA
jgi:(hydroxyamino)benzene mutase